MAEVNAKYTSEWDCGTTITTECKFDPDTKIVYDIEDSGVEIDGTLMLEYVTLPNGKELREDEVEFDY